jgi:hypothetical protein
VGAQQAMLGGRLHSWRIAYDQTGMDKLTGINFEDRLSDRIKVNQGAMAAQRGQGLFSSPEAVRDAMNKNLISRKSAINQLQGMGYD